MAERRIEPHAFAQMGPIQGLNSFEPAGKPAKVDDERKVQTPVTEKRWWYEDRLSNPKQTIELETSTDKKGASAQAEPNPFQEKGWSPHDTLNRPQPIESATSGASAGPAPSWFNWIGSATKAAIEKVKAFAGSVDIVDRSAQVWNAISDIIHPSAWLEGWKQISTSLWTTLNFATEAVDTGADRVIIPKQNADGSPNLLGGRTLSKGDVHALHDFRDDSYDFFDNLKAINEHIGDEGTLIALLKALAADKQKEYELLKEKVLLARQDRDIDLRKRLELMKDLNEKIKENRWYDWFFDATQHSTMAFAGIALGAAGGGWFWPVTVLAFAGANMLNTYADHPIESGMASISSKVSSWTLGGKPEETQRNHLGYFKAAHGMFSALFMATVGAHQSTGISQVVMKTVMSLSSIAQNAAQYRKSSLHHEAGKVDAESTDVARKLKDKEESLSSAYQEFAKNHKKQMRYLEQAAQQLERSGQFIRGLLRSR